MLPLLENAKLLPGKVAVVRLDFNDEDYWRMEKSLPTLRLLLARGVRIVILSHRGRPQGKEMRYSLRKDARMLQKLLATSVKFVPHFRLRQLAHSIAKESTSHQVYVLENIRFLRGEYRNDINLARRLAALGDFFVNDAFAVAHRAAASTVGITKFLPSFAGIELAHEITALRTAMYRPQKPLVVLLGGAKVHTKLPVLRFFRKRADTLLAGGAVANTILVEMGFGVGDSIIDPHPDPIIRKIVRYPNLVLPCDYHISRNRILDIGPKTIRKFSSFLRNARTIIWNGPLGLIEQKKFCKGTEALARTITRNRKAFSIVGGGETESFVRKRGLAGKFSLVSTGGGAMLMLLSGEKLPAIEALRHSRRRK